MTGAAVEGVHNPSEAAGAAQHRCCKVCTAHLAEPLPTMTTVRVGRDETRWPSHGSWPTYRGRKATIVSVNREVHDSGPNIGQPFHLEYGVCFDAYVHPTKEGAQSWFLPHELEVLR